MKEKNRNQLILEYANEYSRIRIEKGWQGSYAEVP